MRNYTLKACMLLLTVTGLFAGNALSDAQTLSHPSAGLVVTGDVKDAASGTYFIDVVYNREGKLYFARLDDHGVWSAETYLGDGTEACLAVDNENQTHIAFVAKDTLYYLSHNGIAWTATDTIVSLSIGGTGKCSKPDIAVDDNGGVHMTYTDSHGSSGDNYTYPDIMYAKKADAEFAVQLIHRGYRDYSSSGSWAADYFSKGSYIAVNGNGDYFIMAHQQNIWRWISGTDNTYFIRITSNLGTGSISNYGTDIYTIHNLHYDGSKVWALYKESTFKVSELTVSGTDIGFSNTQGITATSVSSVAGNGTDLTTGGITSTKLFTSINGFGHIYDDQVVKGTVVANVEVAGVFFSVYTGNSDGMIKVREVAEPFSITSFGFAEQTGPAFIDGQAGTVSIEVANGSDLSNLTATFLKTSDATVVYVGGTTQSSGVTANDFTSPLTYRLTNGMVARDWLVTVSEKPMVYAVSTTADPVAGGTTYGDGDYEEGTAATVKARAALGYGFKHWMEGEAVVSTDTAFTFTVSSERNLKAVFIEQYTLTITTDGSGSVEVDDALYTDVITANSGTVLSLEAIAGARYHFTGWSGDVTGTTNPVEIALDSNIVVTASFAMDQYTLTIATDGIGTVEVDDAEYTDVITANSGTVLSLEAIAGALYHFSGWSGDIAGNTNPLEITLDSNIVITADFAIDQYTLTIVTEGSGSVEVDDAAYTGVVTANSGTVLNLEAIAANGFEFTGWSGDLNSTTSTAALTMDGNKTINASFTAVTGLLEQDVPQLSVYPNPVVGEVYLSSDELPRRACLFNLSGQQVMDVMLNGSRSFDVSMLTGGVYMLTVEFENGERLTGKMQKQ
ncbi:MAG: T9SS type A sorting domain-containing protein [Bacteroidales bacterium]|nr:T9SS type A sorting domain-containing protein [Bacteroidales bacterium]